MTCSFVWLHVHADQQEMDSGTGIVRHVDFERRPLLHRFHPSSGGHRRRQVNRQLFQWQMNESFKSDVSEDDDRRIGMEQVDRVAHW